MAAASNIFRVSTPSPSIAHVEISNPARLNALTFDSFLSLQPLFTGLSNDPSIRVIILSGAGTRAFTAGLDLSDALSPTSGLSQAQVCVPHQQQMNKQDGEERLDPARVAMRLKPGLQAMQAGISAIAQCSKPVIAAIHGTCLGAGVDIASACDIRFASASSQLSVREVHIGIAADLGVLSRLPKIVGNASWVKDICLTGRIFGAEEARKEGLVSWVGKGAGDGGKMTPEQEKEEVLGKAMDLAKEIAALSPVAVQGTKEILDHASDHTVEESLRYTAVWNIAMVQTADTRKALEAAKGKKRATFAKL